jgi:hypothetical protein
MNFLDAVYLVAGLASIGGFVLAIYYARKSRRMKVLIYETTSPVALATSYSPEGDYKLAVTYQRKGFQEERFESVYTRFLRFANLGRESIRREDIAPANPIQVKIDGVRTLDIALTQVSRRVNNIEITGQSISENSASAGLAFDYLDHDDGGLIQILTVTSQGAVSLMGDVIGMPNGIRNVDETHSETRLSKLGPALAILFLASSLAISIMSYRWITGSWRNGWLLSLPFIALGIALIIIALATTIWPSGKPAFPRSLSTPSWFGSLLMAHGVFREVQSQADSVQEAAEQKLKRLEGEAAMKEEEIRRLKEELRWRR